MVVVAQLVRAIACEAIGWRFDPARPPHENMYSEDLLFKVKNLVEPTYKQVKVWCHGWTHVLNVVSAAEAIAKMENVDPVLCQIAAYCHDLGRLEEEQKSLVNFKPGAPSAHAVMSAKPTKKILDEVGISGQDADDIVEAVKIHNIRKYDGPNKIALILQDADRSDGFGKFAVLRFANFNCEIDISEPQSEKKVDESITKVKDIFKRDSIKRQRMVETLEYVFDWCDVLANTESLKRYIRENYDFNRKFLNELKSY